jgi:hypothetical protein
MGDSENRSTSNNEVYLHRVKNQAGEDSTYYTARYNTTPSDNRGYVLSALYSEPLWKGAHLQASYEMRYSQNKSDRKTYDFSHLPENPFTDITPVYREWDPWIGKFSMDNGQWIMDNYVLLTLQAEDTGNVGICLLADDLLTHAIARCYFT